MSFPHDVLSGPMDFAKWIEEIRPQLQPPVGNKLMFGGQQKIMVVGGPNTREDYHIEEGEEIFFQLSGAMTVEAMERGARKPVPIPEGHIFCLPGRIPHSPQRLAGTVGLVIERDRLPGETDGLRWYCRDGSGRVLYEEWFACTDLGVQLKPVINRFFGSECYKSGVPEREFPPPPLEIDTTTALMTPVSVAEWVAAHATGASRSAVLCGPGAVDPSLAGFQFAVSFHTGGAPAAYAPGGEVFVYALPSAAGPCRVQVTEAGSGSSSSTFDVAPGQVQLVPGGGRFATSVAFAEGGTTMVVTNSAFGAK